MKNWTRSEFELNYIEAITWEFRHVTPDGAKVAKAEEDEGEKETPEGTEVTEEKAKEAAEDKTEEEKIEEKEWVIVKNARFDYLFKTTTEFLGEIPQKAEDWTPPEPEAEED